MGNEVKDDAKKDVEDIKATYKKDGAEAATKKMHEELTNNAGKDGRTAEQQKEYVAEMTKLMTEGDNPILPKISEAWLRTHPELKNNNGIITDDRLYMAREMANGDALKQAFLDDIRKRYNEIRDKRSDYVDGISAADLDEAVKQRDDKRAEENKTEEQKARNLERARILLQDNGKLFTALDTAGWGGTADGYISKTDMTEFLENEQANRQLGYTDEHFKAVREMLDNWSGGEKNDTGAIDYTSGWGNSYITKQSLAQGLGYGEGTEADIARMQTELGSRKAETLNESKTPVEDPNKKSDNPVVDRPPEVQEKDAQGRVKKVKFADGNVNEYEYDEQGRVKKMTETSSDNKQKIFVREGDSWKESTDGGKTFTPSKVKDITVDQSTNTLTIVAVGDNGKDVVTTVDGKTGKKETREVEPLSIPPKVIDKDAECRVKTIEYADGNKNQFEYDEKGNVVKMTVTDKNNNSTIYQKDGDKWKESKDGGKSFTDSQVKNISVDQQTNTLTIETSENGKDYVTTVDGKTGKKESREKAAAEFSEEYATGIKQIPGKGFWHVAKAMLPEGTADTDPRIKIIMQALKKQYIENSGDEQYKRTGIPAGDKFLKYQFFKDAAALQKFVDELAKSNPELKAALMERSKPKPKAA